MTQINYSNYAVSYIFIILVTTSYSLFADESLALPDKKSFNVMAPLDLQSEQRWDEFDKALSVAKEMGIDGVSVDVWWGKVEAKGDQVFDWSYYEKLVELLAKHKLEWIPIMSFHQCGGNVGDDCDIPIPTWIWTHFKDIEQQGLKFKSEQGNFASETLSFWNSEEVKAIIYQQYTEFTQAFTQQFSHRYKMIQELNVSMGSAGELRYPSYNSHDNGTGYPTRGAIQGQNLLARKDFLSYLAKKYGNIDTLNKHWNSSYKGFQAVNTQLNFEEVFAQAKHYEDGVAKDYLSWYHESLLNHGKSMLIAAHKGFTHDLANIPLAYKIPGIHWKISATGGYARSAEFAAGLIPPIAFNESNAYGYEGILSIAKDFEQLYQRKVIVHFTALEMTDNENAPAYSKAKTLVSWIGKAAHRIDIIVKGENALAFGVHSKEGWQNINDAIGNHYYHGLTVLRIGDVIAKPSIAFDEYRTLINRYR